MSKKTEIIQLSTEIYKFIVFYTVCRNQVALLRKFSFAFSYVCNGNNLDAQRSNLLTNNVKSGPCDKYTAANSDRIVVDYPPAHQERITTFCECWEAPPRLPTSLRFIYMKLAASFDSMQLIFCLMQSGACHSFRRNSAFATKRSNRLSRDTYWLRRHDLCIKDI